MVLLYSIDSTEIVFRVAMFVQNKLYESLGYNKIRMNTEEIKAVFTEYLKIGSPQMCIAIIHYYKIAWAKGYG